MFITQVRYITYGGHQFHMQHENLSWLINRMMQPKREDTYSISDLAKEFNVSTRTIRYYEDEGLIHPIRDGTTRRFRPSDRRLLMFILRGKRLGFTIAEIREIIGMYKEPPGEAGQLQLLIQRVSEKREKLSQKRKDIEETIAELDQVEEKSLARMAELGVGRWNRRF